MPFRAPLLANRPSDFKCGGGRGDDSAAKTLAPAEPVWSKTGTVTISGGWKTDFRAKDGTTSMYAPKATGGGGVKVMPSVKITPK